MLSSATNKARCSSARVSGTRKNEVAPFKDWKKMSTQEMEFSYDKENLPSSAYAHVLLEFDDNGVVNEREGRQNFLW